MEQFPLVHHHQHSLSLSPPPHKPLLQQSDGHSFATVNIGEQGVSTRYSTDCVIPPATTSTEFRSLSDYDDEPLMYQSTKSDLWHRQLAQSSPISHSPAGSIRIKNTLISQGVSGKDQFSYPDISGVLDDPDGLFLKRAQKKNKG